MKNSLRNIKSLYENKKKALIKNKSEDKEKEEKLEQPSKKKKTNNKKNTEIVDVSNIVAKLSKIEDKEENGKDCKIEECITPLKEPEIKNIQEMAEDENNLKSPAKILNLDLNYNRNNNVENISIKISTNKESSAKKPKTENVSI